MKKLLMILALLASIPMFAERVDPETARKVATTFLSNNGAKSTELTDLSKAAGFANLYIFTTDESFVVMAADDCVKPILGYSFTGNFETEGMPENISSWLQGYSDEIQYAVDNRMTVDNETAQLWKDLTNGNSKAARAVAVVNNLLSTTWDQNPRYNNLCPYSNYYNQRTVTGCVATAMAQIMKYWNYPSHGIGSHSYTHYAYTDTQGHYHDAMGELSADFGATTYGWANMPNALSSSSSTAQINAIATLMYHCGVSVEMDYGVSGIGGSGAQTAKVATALQHYFNYQPCTFKYKADNEDNWVNMLKTELNASRPLQYSGRGSGGGHSFVCCGYDDNDKFYFNWGWSGSCDGFFTLTNLNPPTGGAGSAGLSFNDNQGAIFGIQPVQCAASEPTVTYSLTDIQSLTISWEAVANANSYNIYCDNNYIGNTTSTAYTTTTPFGTHYYYVRSVDSNGNMSLSSNTIDVTVNYQVPAVDDLAGTLSNNTMGLSWTAPQWCYPETPSEALYYGTQIPTSSYMPWETYTMYWGHRHLSENLTNYDGMKLYSVEFHANNVGTYEVCIYEGTTITGEDVAPTTLISTQSITIAATGWCSINLSTPYIVDKTKDLWIFIHNPQTINELRSYLCTAEGAYGMYYSSNPLSYTYNNITDYAFLIKGYLTDGTYTYNLYQDNEKIAENLTETTYADATLKDNAPNLFQVTTNYYRGEAPSNKIGFAKGNVNFEGALTLGDNDKMTVTEGSALTVTGNLSNDNAANLVIENGAQLIHHSDDVMATYQKDIAGYIGDGGWFTIAIPFASYTPAGSMISSEYDLYAYIENGAKEWDNYKPESFDLLRSSGYLYAHNPGITLNITGTLNNGDYTETVDLSYGNTNADLRGYNLLGNPTAHDITFTKTEKVSDGYYYLDNSENWVYADNNTVPAGRGFLVKANASNQTVTLNPQSKNGDGDGETQGLASLQIDVDGASVYVKMTDGVSMPLLSFKGKNQGLYLSQDGKPYVMLVKGDNDNLSLHYKARENGTHTIHLSPLTFNFSPLTYLHLIDNLTGADIDLLKTPSYTFESQATDYEARFQLVFRENANPSEDADVFAYYADGYIHLLGIHDNATIQVIDATGRVIANTTTRTLTTTGWAPGVYIIRLMDENFIKTQKIIINK